MQPTTTIRIINNSSVLRMAARAISLTVLVLTPIAFGAVMNSSAMQWVGFLFGLLFILTSVAKFNRETTFASVDEAIRHLEQLKASGEAH